MLLVFDFLLIFGIRIFNLNLMMFTGGKGMQLNNRLLIFMFDHLFLFNMSHWSGWLFGMWCFNNSSYWFLFRFIGHFFLFFFLGVSLRWLSCILFGHLFLLLSLFVPFFPSLFLVLTTSVSPIWRYLTLFDTIWRHYTLIWYYFEISSILPIKQRKCDRRFGGRFFCLTDAKQKAIQKAQKQKQKTIQKS